jgi:DNA-binding NarL/FixJ family response regulator
LALQILLVDDHALFREALVHVLMELDQDVAVLQAGTASEALEAASHYRDLDLVLLDLALPGVDGLSVLPKMRHRMPTVPIVVLSGIDKLQIVHKAISAGAAGFISKASNSVAMKNALSLVLSGEIYFPPALVGLDDIAGETTQASPRQSDSNLTQRQLEVLELLSHGLPNKSIANRLDLTEGTIKLHITAILRKLRVRNRTEAVRVATQRGVLTSFPSAL